MADELPRDAPAPRLCFIKKTFPEQEYGFNLHAERGKGQYIGEVDANSPADLANLQPGDRILGVNGLLVDEDNHKQVVIRVKENPLQCELFVITMEGETWYKEMGIQLTMDLPNIISCSAEQQNNNGYTIPPPDYEQIVETQHSPPHSEPMANDVSHSPKLHTPPPPVVETRPRLDSAKLLPRFCVLEKHSSSDEFGFNLHAEKGRGHFIGKVDHDSIADCAGLELGQRIVGVNGELIYPNTPHKDVVFLIKKDMMRTELLVASDETDKWHRDRASPYSFTECDVYHARQRPLSESQPVIQHDAPSPPAPISSEKEHHQTETVVTSSEVIVNGTSNNHDLNEKRDRNRSTSSSSSASHPSNSSSRQTDEVGTISITATPTTQQKHHQEPPSPAYSTPEPVRTPDPPQGYSEIRKPSPKPKSPEFKPTGIAQLDDAFRMSAAEMREQLARRRKADPKKDQNMTLQEKYNIVTNM